MGKQAGSTGARWRRGWGRAGAALLLAAQLAQASAPQISGEVGASLWSSDRRLGEDKNLGVGRVKLAADWQATDGLMLRGEAWLMSAPEQLDGGRNSAGLRELFAEMRALPCSPALGKRFIAWGKTDALNPSDQLSPTHYRRMTAKESDQRSGVWGLHLNCAIGAGPGAGRLQAHLLDHFQFNEVPLAARPGIRFQQDRPRPRPTVALRYEVMGEAADWSLAYIDGHDLNPTLALRSLTAQGLLIGREATPMRLVGADMALTTGSAVLRAEAAWVDYPRPSAGLQAQRRPYVFAVMQAERSLGDRETVAAQGFIKLLRGPLAATGSPLMDSLQAAQGLLSNELDPRQYGMTLRYARPLWESRADLDLLLIYARPRKDWLLRARLSYALSDSWRASTGLDLFRGPPDSYLGNLRANSLAFVELSAAW